MREYRLCFAWVPGEAGKRKMLSFISFLRGKLPPFMLLADSRTNILRIYVGSVRNARTAVRNVLIPFLAQRPRGSPVTFWLEFRHGRLAWLLWYDRKGRLFERTFPQITRVEGNRIDECRLLIRQGEADTVQRRCP